MMLTGYSLTLDVLILSALPLIIYRVLERLRAYWLTFRASSPTPVVARLLAPIVATYKYTEAEFYGVDGAPEDVQAKRRAGMDALSAKFAALEGPKVCFFSRHLLRRVTTRVERCAGILGARAAVEAPHSVLFPPCRRLVPSRLPASGHCTHTPTRPLFPVSLFLERRRGSSTSSCATCRTCASPTRTACRTRSRPSCAPSSSWASSPQSRTGPTSSTSTVRFLFRYMLFCLSPGSFPISQAPQNCRSGSQDNCDATDGAFRVALFLFNCSNFFVVVVVVVDVAVVMNNTCSRQASCALGRFHWRR